MDVQARWGGDFGIPRCILPTTVCLRLRNVKGFILQVRTHSIGSIHKPIKVSNVQITVHDLARKAAGQR